MASKAEQLLLQEMLACEKDPLRFVMMAFEWGAGELEDFDGPDKWQEELLNAVRDGLMIPNRPVLAAISSGKGCGKSTCAAWLLLWALCTRVDTRAVVTANTMPQLMTKTWPELMKWHRRLICSHWFDAQATAMYAKDPKHQRTWRIDAIPWNETNPEAFAGLHNLGRRILFVMDEASSIHDSIWVEGDGMLTDKNTDIVWVAFGNPTRGMGRFKECFGLRRDRWRTWQIDSRTVKITNKEELNRLVNEYGEDSDYTRIYVKGQFPRVGLRQLIDPEVAEAARAPDRDTPATLVDPLAVGVDVGRFGDDPTVIRFRRGRDARSQPPIRLSGKSVTEVAATVNQIILSQRPQGVFIDAGGVGGGVIDNLRMMGHRNVYAVDFGSSPTGGYVTEEGQVAYYNRRSEMWGRMKDWLPYGMIDSSPELFTDLTSVMYDFKLREGRDALLLEKKEDMKKRGLKSPNDGDALALTFAVPLPQGDYSAQWKTNKNTHQYEYDPFQSAREAFVQKPPQLGGRQGWWPGRDR